MTSSEAPGALALLGREEAILANANAPPARPPAAKETTNVPKSYDILFLRLAIMFTLASLLAGTTALTFFLSSATWRGSLTQLVQSYQDDLIQRSSDDIVHLFNSGVLCGRVLEGSLQRIYVAPINGTTRDSVITRAIFDTFTDCAQTSSLAFLKEDGTYTLISSTDNVTLGNKGATRLFMSFNNKSTPAGVVPPRYTAYLSEETGEPVSVPQRASPIDPRLRDYYIQAKSSPDGAAAQLLVGANGRPQFVLARRIALPKTGQVIGVVTMSFYLTTISRFMSEFDLKGGLMYVTNGTMLVADTVNDYPATNDQATPVLVPANESSNPVVRESFTYLQAVTGGNSREVHLGGSRYFLHYKDLLYRNITLRQVMVLPRQSIMGSIDSGARYTKAIVSGVAAAICALGFLLIVLFTDPVSKEMRLKAQLIENLAAKRQAEAREEFKTKFFSRTSHDLRTPSAAMLGLLDVIIESEDDPEQSERVQQVKDCALNQLDLLNDILDFSKIEAGKMELECAEFDIGTMLEQLADMLSVTCSQKGLEIGVDLSESLPRIVRGDATRCRQIFTNLLSNSIKFTKEGYVFLRCFEPPETAEDEINTSPFYLDDNYKGSQLSLTHIRLDFVVEDTGCGIPPEKRDVVFQDYCQAEASTTRHHGGTGLGLGIVKTLIEMMGGQIRIVDKPGPGTQFHFYLLFERDVIKHDVRLSEDSHQSGLLESCPSFDLRDLPPDHHIKLPPLRTRVRVVLGSASRLSRVLAAAALRHLGVEMLEATKWDKTLEEVRKLASLVEDLGPPEEELVMDIKNGEVEGLVMGGMTGDKGLVRDGRTGEGGLVTDGKPGKEGLAVVIPTGTTGNDPPERAEQALSRKPLLRCALLSVSLLPINATPRDVEAAAIVVRETVAAAGKPTENGTPQSVVQVVWVCPSGTPAAIRRALRRAGFPIIVNKPLYESKLHRLLLLLAGELDDSIPPCGSPVIATESGPPSSFACSPRQRLKTSFSDCSGVSNRAIDARDLCARFPSPRTSIEIVAEEPLHVAAYGSNPQPGSPVGSPVGSPRANSGDQPLKGLTVLVAEDSPILQLLAVKSVKKLGAEVVTANDGGEALAAFEERRNAGGAQFDLVLIDCQMPVMSGLDVTRCIRAREQGRAEHTPVVMLTATASAQDQQMSADAGVDLYLTKPIDASTFSAKVVALLRKHEKI